MASYQENINIGYYIDFDKAIKSAEEFAKKLEELKKNGQLSAEEIAELEQNLKAMNNVASKSSKNLEKTADAAADMKGSLDDTKDATDGLEKALSVLDATDNSVIKGFRDILNYAKNASKGFSDMKKAVDSYKKGATGADKATKGLTSSLLKNPLTIIIALVALLVAGIVKWVKVTREQAKAIRELELDKFEKHLENINNIYDRYDKILTKLGATQSQMTESNIRRMEEEVKIMENKRKLLHTQFEETEASFNIIGNQTELYEAQFELYAKLDDEQKKYVDHIIDANRKISELNSNINLARYFTIKIEKASEKYTEELQKQSLQYKKADVALKNENVQLQAKLNLLEQLGNYTEDYYDIENKLFENEQKQNRLQIKANNDRIKEINRVIGVYEQGIKDLNVEKLEKDWQLVNLTNPVNAYPLFQQYNSALGTSIAYQNQITQLKNQITEIQTSNSMLSNNIKNNETILNSKYMLRLNSALKEGNEAMIKYIQNIIRLDSQGYMPVVRGDLESEIVSPFEYMTNLIEESYKWMTKFNEKLDKSSDVFKKIGIEVSGNKPIIDVIKQLNEYSGDKASSDYINAMNTASRLASEFYNNIDKSNNELKSSLGDIQHLLDNMVEFDVMEAKVFGNVSENWTMVGFYDDLSKAMKAVNFENVQLTDSQKKLYDVIIGLGEEAKMALNNFVYALDNYYTSTNKLQREVLLNMDQDMLLRMENLSSLGLYTLRDVYAQRRAVLDSEKKYLEASIDEEAAAMKQAGMFEVDVAEWVEKQKLALQEEYNEKRLKNIQDFSNESLEIGNNIVQDFSSIFNDINSVYEQNELDRIKRIYGEESAQYDKAVKEYKKKEGAMLAASTISNAAQAFGSTYANAPGGAAAKAAQAALASAAVVANGIRAYNELMRVDRENNTITQGAQQTGVSSVTDTLVARGIVSPASEDVRYILPVDDVTAIQMSQNRIRISAQM